MREPAPDGMSEDVGPARVRGRILSTIPKFPALIVGGTIIIALVAPAISGSLVPEETAVDLGNYFSPPWPIEGSIASHPFGTDRLGRDILSRMVIGARLSLAVALISIVGAATIGSTLGVIAGYLGGWWDAVIMRAVDVMFSFPAILVALMFVMTVGASFWMVVTILGILLWPHFARLVRGEVLSWKERDFVALSRVAGASGLRIVFSHIVPNIASSLIVLATLQIGWVIVVEGALSFLGAGIPPPAPTWGNMVAEGRGVLRTAWWVSLIPGIAIALVVLAFNLLGDWLRDSLDPRLRQLIP